MSKLVLRKSKNIEEDLKRNYSLYYHTLMAADSKGEYIEMVQNNLANAGLGFFEDGEFEGFEIPEVITLEEGVYCLKHHEWLSGVEINEDDFDNTPEDGKEEFLENLSWGGGDGVFVEDFTEFVSFDGEASPKMIWSNGMLHVFAVEDTDTETSPGYSFIDAF